MKLKLNNGVIFNNVIVILFFSLFMIIQRTGNIYFLLSYFIFGEFFIYLYLSNSKIISKNTKRLLILVIFFWFQEFSSAQDYHVLKYTVYIVEILVLTYLLLFSLFNIKRKNLNEFKKILLLLIAFMFLNFCGIILTYQSFEIFLYSTYDTLKYFILIFYILSLNMKKKDFIDLLMMISGIVIINTFVVLMQFIGKNVFFDIFRGRFNIVSRNGNMRAIGIFPYGIELGNYCCILFAFYYGCIKQINNYLKYYFIFIELLLLICIFASGTRTSMGIIIILLILFNIKTIKGWIKGIIILTIFAFLATNMLNIDDMIARTKWDVNAELPRSYYLKKGIDIWKDNAFFGIGYGTYGSNKYRERTDDIVFNSYNVHKFDYANLATTDSFISEILPEYGIFGILLILLLGVEIIKQYKIKHDIDFYKTFILVIISIIIMSYNSSTVFFNSHIGSWFWISCGFLLDNSNEQN